MPEFDPPLKITIEAVEQTLLDRLKAKVAPDVAAVDVYPDDPANYKMKHLKGELLVRFAGAVHSTPATDDAVTERTLTFDVAVLGRGVNRRGHKHASMLVDLVRVVVDRTGRQ